MLKDLLCELIALLLLATLTLVALLVAEVVNDAIKCQR
jgi:hypothetical protein